MIVVCSRRATKETHTMAEGHRMTAAGPVDKLVASEHADVLRNSVAWLVVEMMGSVRRSSRTGRCGIVRHST
jgi:hypothetical protein